jgi:hypothetical protein
MTLLGQSKAGMASQARASRRRLGAATRTVLGVIALGLVGVPALESGARTAEAAMIENRRVLSYPIDQVWPTAIRYLRIDRGFEIVDRDRDAGYLLFEFPLEQKRIGSGSVEMFEAVDASGRPSVSISVNTGAGPVHLPNSILDGIAAKVRAERGQPPPPPPPKQEEPPKDKPDDDDDGSVPLLPPATDPGEEQFE